VSLATFYVASASDIDSIGEEDDRQMKSEPMAVSIGEFGIQSRNETVT
jgi:hypothetical protein